MQISCVTLDKLHNLFVPGVSFLKNEENNACLAIYLMGILAEQRNSCSVYEVLKGKMLAECEISFHHVNVVTLLFCTPISARRRTSALSAGMIPQDSLSFLVPWDYFL